jgi:SAM-dependent methyltransferase
MAAMLEDERSNWNQRYAGGSHTSLEADPLLPYAFENFIEPQLATPGCALDLAGGIGRHAIWLARRGWRVKLIDISEVGIAKAKQFAGSLAEAIEFETADLTSWTAEPAAYDVVLVFFYLQRDLFPELVNALRPGGLLIYKTYTGLQPKFGKGPAHPMHLLHDNELLRAFSSLKILHYQETVRDRGVAELVAQKPTTK